jgi:hypothetical protein
MPISILNQPFMENKSKKKPVSVTKVTSKKAIKVYGNDKYFVEQRDAAALFLKKAGLPESFI